MARSERRPLPRAAWLGPLAVVALTACSAVLGLDDFDKVECTGGRCEPGTPIDAGTTTRDAAPDAPGVDSGAGAEPAAWPRWPIPNPRDAGADGSMATASLAPAGTGEVLDAVTGLVWRVADAAPGAYEDARDACKVFPGYRLPKRIELVTLLDHSVTGAGPKIDPLLTTQPEAYWTSSEVRPLGEPSAHWAVDFGTGHVKRLADSARGNVRCVKGAL